MQKMPLWSLMALVSAAVLPAVQAGENALQEWRTLRLSDTFFSEGATVGDLNRDGRPDVVSGPYWYEGPEFDKRHAFYEPKPFDPHRYSDNFFAYIEDFSGDGWADILVIGFPGKEAFWYENPQGQKRYWRQHLALERVDNESPTYVDLTGDGRREIVCSREGHFGYAEPMRENPYAPWRFRRISGKATGGRFTHGMGVGDVDGDGRLDLLEKSGWWRQPNSLKGDPLWTKHPFAFSRAGGAQMYAYDFDGDGDNDVITSLAAHGYGLAWYEHKKVEGEITFERHQIMGDHPRENRYGVAFSELHAVDLADIDGDGIKDIVTGKRYWSHGPHGSGDPTDAPVLYWFRTVRTDQASRRREPTGADPEADASDPTSTPATPSSRGAGGSPAHPEADASGSPVATSATGGESVDFVPHLIHDNSGVGVEVKVRDANGDGLPDVIVGNKKGTFVHIQSRRAVSKEEWRRAQPVPRENAAEPLQAGLAKHDGLLPPEAARAMTVPEGFKVQLAAGEPQVHQPIAMAIDERGRLWVAEAYTYPRRAPDGQGRDKIVILEDGDGDGSFETRKVFAEGLNLVSGLQVGFGGVWVGAAPYLMFIPDRDRDDEPDGPPEILLDGFGYHDTHETLNSFIWGPDGWLYGCHGVFTHSKVGKPGTPDEERVPLNAGIWRYHPVRHEFEVFAHGTSNPWGVDFNDRGQAFATACVIPHLYHVVQGARYQRQAGQHFNRYVFDDIKTIADHRHYAGNIRDHAWWGRNQPVAHLDTDKAGGGHAHCGAMIYLGDNWPDHYRNTIFMANIHGNRVNNDVLRRRGSGFVGTHGHDFLFANDRWFRGISLKYGPDGGVYVSDWYDKNACHRPNPEIWDRTNGRIYKVTYGAAKPPETQADNSLSNLDLARLSDAELVALHTHKNEWYARTARRILQERAATRVAVVEPTSTPATRSSRGAAGSPAARPQPPAAVTRLRTLLLEHDDTTVRLRALWTLHTIGGLSEELTIELLDDEGTPFSRSPQGSAPLSERRLNGDPGEYLRGWLIQLALEDREVAPALLARLVEMAKTDRSPVVRLYLASGLQRLPLSQRWDLARALVAQADDTEDHNIPLLLWYGIEPLVTADPGQAVALARASRIPLIRRYIVRRAAVDPEALNAVLAWLGESADAQTQLTILREIAGVVKSRGRLEMPDSWPQVYAKLAESNNSDILEQARFITVKFGDKSVFPALRSIVADRKAAADERKQALSTLLSGQDPQLPPVLQKLLDDAALRQPALRGLARYDDADTPAAILSRYASFGNQEKADAITTLASRKPYAHALLEAIGAGKVPRDDLSAFTVRQIERFGDESLIEKLRKVWGRIRSTSAEKKKLIARHKRQLADDVLAEADLPHGRLLFNETCGKCHRLFGSGGQIGPDITGSNRGNLDYLLENMLDPDAVVGRDYLMTVVITNGGRVISGLITEENESALTIQTENEKVVVPLEDIMTRSLSKKSMMPEGQLEKMSSADIRDLVAYLGSPSQVPLPGQGPAFDETTGRVAGALEGERLKVVARTVGNARSQDMKPFPKDRWSGGEHLWWTGAKPGDKLTLQFPVEQDGRYELLAVMTKARDYGIVRLSVDGKAAGKPLDLYNFPDVITTGLVSLGTHRLDKGPHRLTVEITGAHPKAVKSYMFGLDYLYLARPEEPAAAAGR